MARQGRSPQREDKDKEPALRASVSVGWLPCDDAHLPDGSSARAGVQETAAAEGRLCCGFHTSARRHGKVLLGLKMRGVSRFEYFNEFVIIVIVIRKEVTDG